MEIFSTIIQLCLQLKTLLNNGKDYFTHQKHSIAHVSSNVSIIPLRILICTCFFSSSYIVTLFSPECSSFVGLTCLNRGVSHVSLSMLFKAATIFVSLGLKSCSLLFLATFLPQGRSRITPEASLFNLQYESKTYFQYSVEKYGKIKNYALS